MSRTYRRRKPDAHTNLEYFVSDFVRLGDSYTWRRVLFEKDSKEYAKGLAKFHSDAGTWSFKEPGPSWFRNLYTERPLRRYNRRELHKFMKNSDYESMIEEKGKLEYWT